MSLDSRCRCWKLTWRAIGVISSSWVVMEMYEKSFWKRWQRKGLVGSVSTWCAPPIQTQRNMQSNNNHVLAWQMKLRGRSSLLSFHPEWAPELVLCRHSTAATARPGRTGHSGTEARALPRASCQTLGSRPHREKKAREFPTGLYECSNMRRVISLKSSAEVIVAILNTCWV